VLEEAGVLDGEHRVFHDRGDFLDGCQVAAFFAELAQQGSLGGVDPQGQLGAVVRQVRDVGQVGIGHRQGDCNGQGQPEGAGQRQACSPGEGKKDPAKPSGASARGGGVRLVGRLRWRGRHIAPRG
jgi:hypothetical protein